MNVKHNLCPNNLLKPMNIKPLMGPPAATSKFITPRQAIPTKTTTTTTTTSSRSKPSSESHTILAICEGRGSARGIVGLASININHPVLVLCQIPDGQTYTSTLTKLNILAPSQILIPASFVDTTNRLFVTINDKYPTIVQSIARNEFNRNRGLHYISNLCAEKFNGVKLIIQDKFYAASAACALIRFIENTRIVYAPRSIKIHYEELEDTTLIDVDTSRLLNLTASKNKPSLYGILDKCLTNLGRRLLRTCVLQPPCRFMEIETRHDCVTELVQNVQLLGRLRQVLMPLHSIESSLVYGSLVPASATSVSEKQLTYTLQLKMHLIAIEPLAKELMNTKHPKFRGVYERLINKDKFAIILKMIGDVLNEDAQLGKGQSGEIQRCFAVKSGINGFLDVARKLYTEIVDKMRAYVDDLATKYNLPLKAQHTQKMGFHIILPLNNATKNMKTSDLPEIFYKTERYSKHFAMTTIEMVSFGKQIKNTSGEIQSISNIIIYKLLTDIRPYIGDLYELCDDVAFLDMIASFALISSNPGYVRPSLSKSYMLVQDFKHPIMTTLREPVTNSVCALPESNLHVITGPNMSGKTIYVRSLCLIQILSQMGCRIPATKAIIRPCDRLYAQLSNDMTLECGGMSSFTVEMNKLSYLLQTMSDNSFIVLDELCRTTNCDEGFSIALAICEELAQRKAFTFIVTHYLCLGGLAQIYPNCTNWQFEVLEELRANNTRKSLKFTFRKIPGVTEIMAYGIKLARICINSESIVNRASELWHWLGPSGHPLNIINESNTFVFLKHKLQVELDVLKVKGKLTPELKQLKMQEFKRQTGVDFTGESIDCVSSEIKTQSDFSLVSEFTENFESFHDPLNHILKNPVNINNKTEDVSHHLESNDSASFIQENKNPIRLVSDLYFSSSDDEGSIVSLSSSDDGSVLSVDHLTFVKNINSGGVVTSTPIRRKFDDSKDDFQNGNYEKFSTKYKRNEWDSDVSIVGNSEKSLFSNMSFMVDSNKSKKRKDDIFSQDTIQRFFTSSTSSHCN